jgi:branched-chain amino acid transport system ATP-binding protein
MALELRDVHKRFGATEIIRGASLAVRPGERVAIIGPNGAGKSTLFNLISGRFAPTRGEVLLQGRGHRRAGAVRGQPPRPGAQLPGQQPVHALSVFENLRCAVLWSLGYRYAFWKFLVDAKDANERAEQVMRMIHLENRRDTWRR